jgi:hypothetical protein
MENVREEALLACKPVWREKWLVTMVLFVSSAAAKG